MQKKHVVLIVLGLVTNACAKDANSVLNSARSAMGNPKSIQYSGTGMNAFFGQALTAGKEWPRRNLTSYTRTINYDQKSSKEEMSFAQPVFGGQQQNTEVNGDKAWNVGANGPAPQPAAAEERQLQIWLTPHGFIKGALAAGNATLKDGEAGGHMITFSALGKYTVTGTIDNNNMIAAFCPVVIQQRLAAQTQRQMPILQVDPYWPQFPENWIIGVGAGIATDAENNVWIVHRPGTVTEKKACCKPAPAVMEFSPSGKLLQSWSGVGEGYEWPLEKDEHGIFVDYKNNVWIAGRGTAFASVPLRNGTSENQILKFDNKGKFLLQIGRRGKGTGSNDTTNLGQPADIVVYPPTNEVFVADGYGNRRVIVFDADTGAYKRHWGAYGNRPDDSAPKTPVVEGPGDPQFNVVHHVRISRDGLVYVADRLNRRIQIFTIEGKFLKEAFVRRSSKETGGTVSSLAFSADSRQQYLYVADQAEDQILILDRQSLTELGAVGRLGRYAGQFVSPHNIATDSQGNLYVAEDLGGQRVQKFVFKGLGPATK